MGVEMFNDSVKYSLPGSNRSNEWCKTCVFSALLLIIIPMVCPTVSGQPYWFSDIAGNAVFNTVNNTDSPAAILNNPAGLNSDSPKALNFGVRYDPTQYDYVLLGTYQHYGMGIFGDEDNLSGIAAIGVGDRTISLGGYVYSDGSFEALYGYGLGVKTHPVKWISFGTTVNVFDPETGNQPIRYYTESGIGVHLWGNRLITSCEFSFEVVEGVEEFVVDDTKIQAKIRPLPEVELFGSYGFNSKETGFGLVFGYGSVVAGSKKTMREEPNWRTGYAFLEVSNRMKSRRKKHFRHLFGDFGERNFLAKNPLTDERTLNKLSFDPNQTIRLNVARNANTGPGALKRLAREDNYYIKLAVIDNPNTCSEVISSFASDRNMAIREKIVMREDLTEESQVRLALDENDDIRRKLAQRPKISESAQIILASDPDYKVAKGLAINPDISESTMTILARNERPVVRINLVNNPAVTGRILSILGEDNNYKIRTSVANHQRTPEDVLMTLASDGSSEVRSALAANPALPDSGLELLSRDESEEVRIQVARYGERSPEVMEILMKDSNVEVRAAVMSNPSVAPEILAEYSDDPSEDIRKAIAGNPNTPGPTINKLARDRSERVANVAKAHPNAPFEARNLWLHSICRGCFPWLGEVQSNDQLYARIKREYYTPNLAASEISGDSISLRCKKGSGLAIQGVDSRNYPEVSLIASVIDKDNQFISGLCKDDFYFAGDSVEIIRVEEISESYMIPVDMIFVIDETGSMSEEIRSVRDHISYFVDGLSRKGIDFRVGLVTYWDEVDQVHSPTRDISEFRSWLTSGVLSGGSEVSENAIRAALDLPMRPHAQKIIGDGRECYSGE